MLDAALHAISPRFTRPPTPAASLLIIGDTSDIANLRCTVKL